MEKINSLFALETAIEMVCSLNRPDVTNDEFDATVSFVRSLDGVISSETICDLYGLIRMFDSKYKSQACEK